MTRYKTEFARRLVYLIADRGLTHKEVLERAKPYLKLYGRNTTPAHNLLTRYIQEGMYPNTPMLAALARALNTSTDYLCGLVDEENPRITESELSDVEKRLVVAYRTGALPKQLQRIGIIQKLITPDVGFDEGE